jgi:hypothetical protein
MNDKQITLWNIIHDSPKEVATLVSLALLVAAVSFEFLKMLTAVPR